MTEILFVVYIYNLTHKLKHLIGVVLLVLLLSGCSSSSPIKYRSPVIYNNAIFAIIDPAWEVRKHFSVFKFCKITKIDHYPISRYRQRPGSGSAIPILVGEHTLSISSKFHQAIFDNKLYQATATIILNVQAKKHYHCETTIKNEKVGTWIADSARKRVTDIVWNNVSSN